MKSLIGRNASPREGGSACSYLPKFLPSEIATEPSNNDGFGILISSCAAKLVEVWKELSFVNDDDLQPGQPLG